MNGEDRSRGKTIAIIVLAVVCLVLIGLQFLQKGTLEKESSYESFSGVAEDSMEYQSYKSCVDSCAKCELNCKDSFLRMYASSKNDENLCLGLSEEWARKDCENSINNAKAIAGKDKSFCEKITEEFMKSSCLSAVALELAVEKGSIALCDQAPEMHKEGCKNEWYRRMALKTLDESNCEHLTDNLMRVSCIDQVKMAKEMQEMTQKEAGATE